MKFADRIASRIYREAVITSYQKIPVIAGQCRYNFQCHNNVVHDAIENKEKRVAMVFYLQNDEEPILHFLNFTKRKYVDNTMGHWSSRHPYYFVRWLNQDEYWDINKIFSGMIDEWRRKLPWYIRLLSDERV